MSLTFSLQVRREVLDSRGKSKDPKFAQEFTSLLLAMADVRAVLVKLADRLHNLRTAPPGPSREAAAHEALDIFAPLANRLGVWSIKAEMEDLAFQVSISLVHLFQVSIPVVLEGISCAHFTWGYAQRFRR